MTRRPAPYVPRDPRWDNASFFAEWARLRTEIALLPDGPERDALLEKLGFMQDEFFDTAY